MSFELSGKLVKKLDIQSGSSDRGAWSRQDVIVEMPGQYPRPVCISLWNEQVNEAERYNIGDMLKISFDLQSREFNGKWYTSVRPWRMEREAIAGSTATVNANISASPSSSANYTSMASQATADDPFTTTSQQVDDLPF